MMVSTDTKEGNKLKDRQLQPKCTYSHGGGATSPESTLEDLYHCLRRKLCQTEVLQELAACRAQQITSQWSGRCIFWPLACLTFKAMSTSTMLQLKEQRGYARRCQAYQAWEKQIAHFAVAGLPFAAEAAMRPW